MRKVVSFLLAAAILFFPQVAFAQVATLSLDPTNGTFNLGCTFSLNVNLDTGGAQTDGTDAILIYDPTRFIANTITNGNIYPDYPGNNIDASNGRITISGLASVNSPFVGKGLLATVNFTVSSNAPAGASQVSFDFDPNNKSKTTDSNVVQTGTVVDILNSVVNGNYTVGTGSCGSQSPSASAGSSPSPSPGGGTTTTTTTTAGQTGTGGLGSTRYVGGTPSANFPPGGTNIPGQTGQTRTTLPQGGTQEATATIAIVGSILSILGILGLALL